MGIYDRDYYREGPSYLDSLIPSGLVCKWLIALNVVIFIGQLVSRAAIMGQPHFRGEAGWVTDTFILDPQAVFPSGQVWRLLTYAFLHSPDSWMHIVFNMLFLWWFGSDLETMYGPREFLAFYLCAAVFGGIFYEAWALTWGSTVPCLGASGAVTALLILCACHFPHRIVYVMFMVPVPLWLLAVFNVGQDSYRFFTNSQGPVAVVVHLAGAAFAFAYFRYQIRILDFVPSWWGRLKRQRSRPKLRLYRPEEAEARDERVSVPVATDATPFDEHLEAKLDAVLEKLARSGKESLTESEQKILMQASEIYKRRRT